MDTSYLEYVPHLVTMSLYASVIFLAVHNWILASKYILHAKILLAVRGFIIMSIYACTTFVINHIYWVYSLDGDIIGGIYDLIKIHSDHAVALTWICCHGLIRYYLLMSRLNTKDVNL